MTTIKVLVTQEDGMWIAVGLEHYLVGSGASPEEALRDLEQQFEMQEILDGSYGQVPFEMVPRAPEKYWALFATSRWQSHAHSSPYEGELRMAV
jgi:hypothetical protein